MGGAISSGIHAWIARADEDVAGLVELETDPHGDVGIVVFGLVREFVGRGFGGTLLTLATRLACRKFLQFVRDAQRNEVVDTTPDVHDLGSFAPSQPKWCIPR